jgi:hypothetical protein
MASLLASPRAKTCTAKIQLWPRDFDILVASKECVVKKPGGGERDDEVLAVLGEAGAAISYSVGVGGDQRIVLFLLSEGK